MWHPEALAMLAIAVGGEWEEWPLGQALHVLEAGGAECRWAGRWARAATCSGGFWQWCWQRRGLLQY